MWVSGIEWSGVFLAMSVEAAWAVMLENSSGIRCVEVFVLMCADSTGMAVIPGC